jgi:hypothetical protein
MKKELRNFGLIWAFIFCIIALFPLLGSNKIALWALYVSGIFVLLSLLFPQIYQKTYFYQGWIKLGGFLGLINSKIIILFLFYAVFLPIGLILKIFKKDLLRKKLDKSASSYFIDRNYSPQDMKNQF